MSDLKTQREGLINDFKGMQQKIRQYVDNLKQKGSEELLNGSVERAQSLIGAIIPIENAVKKIQVDQDELLKVLESQDEDSEDSEKKKGADENASKNEQVVEDKSQPEPEAEKEEPEEEKQESSEEKKEKTEEAKTEEVNEDELTPQDAFRLPILKALIYLGGSGKVKDVTNFIEKDMKNKFRPLDNEVLNGDGQKEWVKRVAKEQEDMLEEGLLNSDADEGQWEIAQAGIDYLAKNKKSN